MTSFCGSDNDENDYEIGVKDVVRYLEARIIAVEKQEGRVGAHMPRGPYLSAWDDLRTELRDGDQMHERLEELGAYGPRIDSAKAEAIQ